MHQAVMGAAAFCAASCLLPTFSRFDAGAGAGGAASTTTSAGGSACKPVAAPSIPATDLSPNGNVGTVVMAWRHFGTRQAQNGGPLGLDLDGLCTCHGTSAQACKADVTVCDGDSGRDDAAAAMLAGLDAANAAPLDAGLDAGIAAGRWTVLLRIDNYNGLPDDGAVKLRWYFSRGTTAMAAPKWDGSDSWTVDERSLAANAKGNLDMALALDAGGYVAGGVLVGHLTAARIEARGTASALALQLGSVVLVGKLVAAGPAWRLTDAVVGARLGEADAFAALASYRSDSGAAICKSSAPYAKLAQALCDGRDIRSDDAGPTQPCNALTAAVSFSAEPAVLGAVTPKPAPPVACSAGDDPAAAGCP